MCGVSESPETSWPPIHQQFTFYVNSILRLAIYLLVLPNIHLYYIDKKRFGTGNRTVAVSDETTRPTRSGIEPETGPTI